jgi:hypothetical protein
MTGAPQSWVAHIIRRGSEGVQGGFGVLRAFVRKEDFLGEQKYELADGSIVPSAVFSIRSLRVGNKTVEDVRASIASANAPLLLGRSFLNRFNSWSVDNRQHLLFLN